MSFSESDEGTEKVPFWNIHASISCGFPFLTKGNDALPFIPYNNQRGISPFAIQDLIPSNHLSRMIDDMIDISENRIYEIFEEEKCQGLRGKFESVRT